MDIENLCSQLLLWVPCWVDFYLSVCFDFFPFRIVSLFIVICLSRYYNYICNSNYSFIV